MISRRERDGRHPLRAAALAVAGLLACGALWQCDAGPLPVSGTLTAGELRAASRAGGRVTRIDAPEGTTVTRGQVLMVLDAPELTARRDQAAAALAELEAGARPQERDAAKADADALASELETARSDLKKVRDLYRQNAVPVADRDRAASRVTALEKSLAAAKARRDLLTSGPRVQTVEVARARLAETEALLSETVVRAPGDGVVETVSVHEGEIAPPGRELATLVRPGDLSLRVYIPEPWLGFVREGEEVRLRTAAFPGRDFRARVERIARTAEFTPRNVQTAGERIRQTFAVTLGVPPGQDGLRAGMSADALFPRAPAGRP